MGMRFSENHAANIAEKNQHTASTVIHFAHWFSESDLYNLRSAKGPDMIIAAFEGYILVREAVLALGVEMFVLEYPDIIRDAVVRILEKRSLSQGVYEESHSPPADSLGL
jgi:hypothetical protein